MTFLYVSDNIVFFSGCFVLYLFSRKLSSSGGLAKDDKFAITIQCYHNKVREAAGLAPLEWNDTLGTHIPHSPLYLTITYSVLLTQIFHNKSPKGRNPFQSATCIVL